MKVFYHYTYFYFFTPDTVEEYLKENRVVTVGALKMIAVDGQEYPTIEDAVKQFGVSAKTIYDWIENGIIDEPPTIDQGLRTVKIFPKEYVDKAKQDLKRRKESLKKQQKLNKNGQVVRRRKRKANRQRRIQGKAGQAESSSS